LSGKISTKRIKKRRLVSNKSEKHLLDPIEENRDDPNEENDHDD
jgi:hypothetical protein